MAETTSTADLLASIKLDGETAGASKKRTAEEMTAVGPHADTMPPKKKQKVDDADAGETSAETTLKRPNEDTSTSDLPPKKKQKIEIEASKSNALGTFEQKKQGEKKNIVGKIVPIPPPKLRNEILTTFSMKKPAGQEIDKFYAKLGITKFEDAGQKQSHFFKFCEEHRIEWSETGKVSGPTDKDIQQELLKQVEFYFSDGNLPRDNFLLKNIQREDNPERWFQLKVLLRFGLVKKWTGDTEYLAAALVPSTLVELNKEKTMLRRKVKLELTRKMLDKRTTAVHGCLTTFSTDEFLQYFSKFGPVLAVFPKRSRGKKSAPKGVVEVVWETEEVASQFVELKTVTWDRNELKIQLLRQKKDEKKQKTSPYDFNFVLIVKNLPELNGFGELKTWLKADCSLPVHFVMLRQDKKSAILRLQKEEGISAAIAVEKMKDKLFKGNVVQGELVKEEDQATVEKELVGPKRGKHKGKRHFHGKRRRN